ncbi:MAG: hypothetical protein ACI9UQ_002404 [Candidatus Krumholzibacteriia bacterium]|jgi:hypothetical protein
MGNEFETASSFCRRYVQRLASFVAPLRNGVTVPDNPRSWRAQHSFVPYCQKNFGERWAVDFLHGMAEMRHYTAVHPRARIVDE